MHNKSAKWAHKHRPIDDKDLSNRMRYAKRSAITTAMLLHSRAQREIAQVSCRSPARDSTGQLPQPSER